MQEIHDSRKKDPEVKLKTVTGELPQPHLSIHDSRKKGVSTWPLSKRIVLFYQNNRKTFKKLFIFSIILILILFPVWSGSLIGNWIKDFIGTIINIVKTI